jgi:1-acyl-sn-glycerol-3-phosphate acyltransferase
MRIVSGSISYLWKIYIGLMFGSTLLIFYPFIVCCMYVPSWKAYTFQINVCWSRLIRILCFYAVEIDDHNSQQIHYPMIICANHTSYLDIFLLYSSLPQHRFLFMGKSEILSYPLVKTFFKNLNIPVFRGDRIKAAKSFIRARHEIAKGWNIVIFPEGGIPDNNPQLAPFKEGAFKLAKSADCSVLPITFIDNYHLFSDPEFILGPAHPGIARVVIHPLINRSNIKDMSEKEISDATFYVINSEITKS